MAIDLPHWPEEYAKYPAFSAFEADFFTKNENSLPQYDFGNENWSNGQGPDFDQKNWLKAFVLFFQRSQIFGHKIRLNLIEDR